MATAATILREARTRAGLTQHDLGRAAGVTQSVISSYERGRREPSLEQLERLVFASGHRLDIELAPAVGALHFLRAHRDELLTALGELGATNIRVFGSVARGEDGPHSDIDLLVDVDDTVGLIQLGQMATLAEQILRRPVDVVPASSLKPEVRTSAFADAIAL